MRFDRKGRVSFDRCFAVCVQSVSRQPVHLYFVDIDENLNFLASGRVNIVISHVKME